MSDLTSQHCVPCEGGVASYTKAQAVERLSKIPGWTLRDDGKEISRHFKLKNFKEALSFVNQIGEIAEAEGHHPDLELGWGRVGVRLSTHAIKGLSLNDYILAAKINQLRGE
ncbi:MAG: 4a-hydroxytetrahydrobiopterin dehydratase [Parcubacteria group bacterium Gr01-1014_31]|nr:MAG: 4a-hydroxytetrahydrobiopterin dehydratase [Parcubacteria group bacterium Gr01-1014_31]